MRHGNDTAIGGERGARPVPAQGRLVGLKRARKLIVPAWLAMTSTVLVGGCAQKTPAAMAPPTVLVVRVMQKDVPISGDWVATREGFTTAQIQPEVTGYLIKQNYREGSLVHEGDVLFEIDPRPFQAILDQAKGQLERDEATLAKQ